LYDLQSDAGLEFGDTIAVRRALLKDSCDFADSVRAAKQARDRKSF
jgi:hypothetical protein